MPRGVTLLELLLTLVVLGILLVLALPAIGAVHDRLQVESASRTLLAAHQRARFVALAERRITVLDLSAARLTLSAVEAPTDTVRRWETGGPAALGVTVGGMPRRVAFGPSGVGLGVANATYTLRRGAAVRLVIVSRYGRVRIQ